MLVCKLTEKNTFAKGCVANSELGGDAPVQVWPGAWSLSRNTGIGQDRKIKYLVVYVRHSDDICLRKHSM